MEGSDKTGGTGGMQVAFKFALGEAVRDRVTSFPGKVTGANVSAGGTLGYWVSALVGGKVEEVYFTEDRLESQGVF